jgi:hypothetical protein
MTNLPTFISSIASWIVANAIFRVPPDSVYYVAGDKSTIL